MEFKRLNQLRHTGIVEGISTLLLFGVAMPMKYFYDMPMAVRIVGSIHGILFIAYCVLLLLAMMERSWGFAKVFWLFVASVIPFGPFVAEVWLGKEAKAAMADAHGGIADE